MSQDTSIDQILDQTSIDRDVDLNLIVPLEEIETIPIEIRDQYVLVDTDPTHLYHRTLFANENFANDNLANDNLANDNLDNDNLANDDNLEADPKGEACTYCLDSDSEYEYYESSDWEEQYWEELDRRREEEENWRVEEEEYQQNREVIEAVTAPIDTRNRTDEGTKADYRSSNSFVRSHYHNMDPEVYSNKLEVMGGQSAIVTSEAREPRTIIDDLHPKLNGGDSHFYKLLESLEEHAISKEEHKKYDYYRPRRIIKYKVPIIRWEDIKYETRANYDILDKRDRERQSRQREFEEDAGKGIYRVRTRKEIENYKSYNGIQSTRTITLIERVSRVGEFKEAQIPKGICPIDFRVDFSSSRDQKPKAKIDRSSVFDSNSQKMIDIGKAVDHIGCWKPQSNSDKEYLIVDLGQNTRVTHISTMGAPPPVTTFPKGYNSYDTRIAPEYDGPDPQKRDLIYVLYRDRPGMYRGEYLQNYQPYQEGEWVESYELFARPDHGKWIRIGIYTGNLDPFTENIHNVRRDLNDIKFRYLKFVPKSYHNNVAMKIDIFGLASEAETTSTIDRSHLIYTVDIPIRMGTRNGTELVRKHKVGYHDYYGTEKADYLKRRELRDYMKSELDSYKDNPDGYMTTYGKPYRDLHAIKHGLDREEQDLKRAIQSSLRNQKRRRAYRRRRRV